MKIKNNIIELSVPADLHFSAGVREFVNEYAVYNKFSSDVCNKLKLVVDELFMNAVRYGSDKNSKVVVKISYNDNKISGMVEDFGEGDKKISVEELKQIIVEQTNNNVIMKTSGRGLAQIVNKWMDKINIKNNKTGGICIHFEKTITNDYQPQKSHKKPFVTIQPTSLKEKVFVFEGEINQDNLQEHKQTVLDFLAEHENPYRIILDFEKLYYCNSTFIGQIAEWYNKIKKCSGELIIKNPNSDIMDIIDMVGLTKIIPIQKHKK